MTTKKKNGSVRTVGPGAPLPCEKSSTLKAAIERYADELRAAAPNIGSHGLNESQFQQAGLFEAAIERLRGQRSATMSAKQSFVSDVLEYLTERKLIRRWHFTGGGERHDYQVELLDGRISVFEAKGCLDGNNAQIFERPANADEFTIWSLCQNAGADPRHNAWSGIHTRIGTRMIADRKQVDGLIVWDMLCGTLARPCPKLTGNLARKTQLKDGTTVPPPCLYLFPRTIPDPRNNPNPKCWNLKEIGLVQAIYSAFRCDDGDLTTVSLNVRMGGNEIQRQTTLLRRDEIVSQSGWAGIKRARPN